MKANLIDDTIFKYARLLLGAAGLFFLLRIIIQISGWWNTKKYDTGVLYLHYEH